MACFAGERRGQEDVFWFKENAELLNVLECTGAMPGVHGLAAYGAFYEEIERRIAFFPQYYRFFLSLCLDLEDLGLAGRKGEALTHWVAGQGLAGAELSDLQRAEARRLCLRRGVDPVVDAGLDDRLRAFARRSETFALPNKKAAYELTHIIFYLSEYGRRDPGVDTAMAESLRHAGTLAFLELNIDLLSEVCLALRFAGRRPPEAWERWLADQMMRFCVQQGGAGRMPQDEYHPWLMLNWFMDVSGRGGFAHEMPQGRVLFAAPAPAAGPLRELSDSIYRDAARSPDWCEMRERVGERLSDEARTVLQAAEEAVDFEAFFRGFARAARPTMPGVAI